MFYLLTLQYDCKQNLDLLIFGIIFSTFIEQGGFFKSQLDAFSLVKQSVRHKLMKQFKSSKENASNRLKQNKSDLLTLSHPFHDISNLHHNNSSIFLKQKNITSKKTSNQQHFQPKTIPKDQQLINLKFRIPINQFSDDYYIFNLQLKPQLNLSHLIDFFMRSPSLQKIKEKRKCLQSEILCIKNNSKEWQFTGTFSFADQLLQTQTTVRQLSQTLEQSNKKQQVVDFTFDWVQKPIIKQPIKIKTLPASTSQQNCCTFM